MSDSAFPPREPFFSRKLLGIFGGAALWAATQDWIKIATFFDLLLDSWRDLLREVWRAIISVLPVTIKLAPHQLDMLSLNTILLGIVLHRRFWKSPPVPLFYPSFRAVAQKVSDRFGEMDGVVARLLVFAFMIFSVGTCFLVLAPFLDTVQVSHDATLLFLVAMLVAFIPILQDTWRGIVRFVSECIALAYFSLWADVSTKFLKAIATGILAVLLFVAFLLVSYFVGLVAFVNALGRFARSHMDPEPFLLGNYLADFNTESAIDLVLLSFGVLLLYFASGKSLKPLVQLIVLALIIVFAGWLARIFV